MIDGRRILAVVPARGGSKGIPRKNLREVAGVSLIGHVARVIGELGWLDAAVLSTDDPDIAEEGRRRGLDAPFRRPPGLSGDTAPAVQVWLHAWRHCERRDGRRYDVSVLLEPTSPCRTAEHVEAATRLLIEGSWDSIWTVSLTSAACHPLKQLTIAPDGRLAHFDRAGADIVARQQLRTLHHRNGVAYVVTRDCLMRQETLLGARAGALPLDGDIVNIDTSLDLRIADMLLSDR